MLEGGLFHVGDIGGEEAGEDETAVGSKVLHVGGEVCLEDVLVDVGDDGVEVSLDGGGVAEEHRHIIYIIKGEVFLGVLHAEGVDVDGNHLVSATHGHRDAEHTGTCAHVEHALVGEVLTEQEGGDLVGGLVGT